MLGYAGELGYQGLKLSGWPAILYDLVDYSHTYDQEFDRVTGYLRLLPDSEERTYRTTKESFALDSLFICYKKDLSNYLVSLGQPAHLFVTGTLDQRLTSDAPNLYRGLVSRCLLTHAINDESQGKRSPFAATSFCSNPQLLSNVAARRFEEKCGTCNEETRIILESTRRFCPRCRI